MSERRGTRFVVEVVFLAALATALGFAHLSAPEIVAGMAAGWVVVAALEWAAWRGEPHYGSGLPPRYFVPGVNLPPPQPLEQFGHFAQGYPGAAREEAPTWIASAAVRAELLGEWPVAPALADEEEPAEQEEPERRPAGIAPPDPDPWTVASLPAAPLGEDEAGEDEDEAEPADEQPVAPLVRPPRRRLLVGEGRMALYRFDPLPNEASRRRFRRGAAADSGDVVEVLARPAGPRPLPSALR